MAFLESFDSPKLLTAPGMMFMFLQFSFFFIPPRFPPTDSFLLANRDEPCTLSLPPSTPQLSFSQFQFPSLSDFLESQTRIRYSETN